MINVNINYELETGNFYSFRNFKLWNALWRCQVVISLETEIQMAV